MFLKNASITGLTGTQLNEMVRDMGEPAYRAKQLRGWVYKALAAHYQEMTDLPLVFRQELEKSIRLHTLEAARQVAGKDGTIKTLFSLADGQTVEGVLMVSQRESGQRTHTVCVSTQIGCAIGCPFCATGQQGFKRNLTPGEIIDQVLYFARHLKNRPEDGKTERLANIVFMGMGEPLANYEALWQAIRILNSPDGFGTGARNMTISTAGLVPQIKRLSREKLQVGLAVSLHAPDNALRDRLVPVNKKYPLEELIPACREYCRATGRRVSFEYVLFKGINDSIARARGLAQLLQGLNCHVNLIPANFTSAPAFRPPSAPVTLAFGRELRNARINATLRQPRGQDIGAGCGQLRSEYIFASSA